MSGDYRLCAKNKGASINVLTRIGALFMLPDNDGFVPGDKYDVHRGVVGTGSFGTVKKATARSGNGKVVALKTINKRALPDLGLFVNEVEINAAIDHPNIAKLYETFEDSQNVYLVLELCHGGELFDHIISQGSFTEADTTYLMLQILRALYYMHNNDISHRDLKPENFLLVDKKSTISKNILKVIDFGIAKRFKRDHGKTVPMTTKTGTAYYVAPEVHSGSYDEKVDVWSCGVIMYIFLCGSPPFAGDDDRETMRVAMRGKLDFDTSFDHVSEGAKDLIRAMCNLNVAERLSAQQAVSSDWAQRPASDVERRASASHSDDFIQKLRRFGGINRFKRAALGIIAHRLDDVKIRKLRECFTRLDANGDGMLTLAELRDGCCDAGLTDPEVVEKLFTHIDADNSGEIGYTEFLASMIDRKQYIDKETCWEAFRVFDKDGSGHISLAEIETILRNNSDVSSRVSRRGNDNNDDIKELLRTIDADGDGQVSFDEFMQMMRHE